MRIETLKKDIYKYANGISQVDLPKQDVTISRRDDAAMYDDGSQSQDVFKDDSR